MVQGVARAVESHMEWQILLALGMPVATSSRSSFLLLFLFIRSLSATVIVAIVACDLFWVFLIEKVAFFFV